MGADMSDQIRKQHEVQGAMAQMNLKPVCSLDELSVVYRESSRCRRIVVKIEAQRLEVVYPPSATRQQAASFLVGAAPQILDKVNRLRSRQPLQRQEWTFRPDVPLHTQGFDVCVEPVDGMRHIAYRRERDVLMIRYPKGVDQAVLQQQLGQITRRYLVADARQTLPVRLAQLSRQTGLEYASAGVRCARTRWGSCSSAGHISLSAYLRLLPAELTDFVMLHELCHTRYMNHGPQFRALLDRLTQGHERELTRRIAQYHPPRW